MNWIYACTFANGVQYVCIYVTLSIYIYHTHIYIYRCACGYLCRCMHPENKAQQTRFESYLFFKFSRHFLDMDIGISPLMLLIMSICHVNVSCFSQRATSFVFLCSLNVGIWCLLRFCLICHVCSCFCHGYPKLAIEPGAKICHGEIQWSGVGKSSVFPSTSCFLVTKMGLPSGKLT